MPVTSLPLLHPCIMMSECSVVAVGVLLLNLKRFAWISVVCGCVQTPNSVRHMFSKCSIRSPRAPREKPRGSASYSFTY